MKRVRSLRTLLSWLILAAILLSSCPTVALDVPPLRGRVNDYGALLSPATINQLETILKDLETTDSTQIVVLTIPSLQGDNLENFSLKTAETYEIGQKEFDNGALLLIARDERKIRIEVGYGLEGSLTDLIAGRIIRNQMTPQFRNGNFDQGVVNGINGMVSAVRGEYTADTVANRRGSGDDFSGLITSMVFITFFLGSLFRRKRILAAAVGGIAAPLIGFLFFSLTGLALAALVPIGMIGGLIASILTSSTHGPGSMQRRSGRPYIGTGGGFGRSSGGFGGFSGGGGGFGGGGASGGW